ncbi:MAG: PilZ domain-containing protein [Spirochaetota bacterium]|nr:PilZ domain-containing protein [Spirochaetota bacterium]
MESLDDKRNITRQKGFWKVYHRIKGSDKEINLGFLFDISETGVNLWVHRTVEIDENEFIIIIHSPEELNLGNMDFLVHKVWKVGLGTNPYHELGCTFKDLSTQQKKYLYKLKAFFEKQKDTFNGK